MYEKLFSKGRIGNLELKNRVVMTAMGVGVAQPNGMPNKRFSDYYEERAKGGVGLIITEVTRVNGNHGVATPGQLSMTSDEHIKPFAEVVEKIHSHGTKIFVQLHHPGRQNLAAIVTSWKIMEILGNAWPGYWDYMFKVMSKLDLKLLENPLVVKLNNTFMKSVVAPSAVPCGLGVSFIKDQPTRALKISEIESLEKDFIKAAKRVQLSGADGVQLHASHGYLIQQFLSPYTNRRTDKYGGSLENRMRFLLNIIEGTKKECGKDFPVIVRLTVDEFYDAIGYENQGIKLPEGIEMAKILEKAGIDALDVSCASYETLNHLIEPISFEQGWRAYLAKTVKEAVSIPVIAVGVIRTPKQAEELLKSGNQDFIGLGRPLIADPHWAKKAQEGREDEIQRCISCVTCFESLETNALKGEPCECALNPRACREYKYNDNQISNNGEKRTVIVIGAGPAGLTAARECAKRNFNVVLLEKEKSAGGQLNLANKPPHKNKMTWATEDLVTNAKKAGVKIEYGVKVDKKILSSFDPYAIIIATGGTAIKPNITGADSDNVCTVTEILNGKIKIKDKKVAVIGSGMTGLETSELLCEQGNKVTVVEMADKIAPGLWTQHYWDVMPRLKNAGVEFLPSYKLSQISKDSIILESKTGNIRVVPTDYVVLSIGVKSVNEMQNIANKVCKNVYLVGDAQKAGRIFNATKSAFKTAISI